ncbi:hypothetical protein Cni_G28891 [Canna indica]|uniref:Uncharacterized protein n=1 Tax=Canna indica TaxID=4628 RepID=A0AAQ3L3V5_9LILI|nr:hypothetical protein Cni_G28891 [Canna indica]
MALVKDLEAAGLSPLNATGKRINERNENILGLKSKVDQRSKSVPVSWAGLFRKAREEESWSSSKELSEKIAKIQNNAKGRVTIEEKDLEPVSVTSNATTIGKPVKIDEYRLKGSRGKFAKVCVLLDVRKPVEQGVWIDTKEESFFQTIAYEN